ncbi:hypothetical protein OF830_19200 [Bacillus paramycoides]|nr:hypothetical protein [Bacillus paramycoides]MCW9133025.1 hypothetical protein [Bacillus paramycoides]
MVLQIKLYNVNAVMNVKSLNGTVDVSASATDIRVHVIRIGYHMD